MGQAAIGPLRLEVDHHVEVQGEMVDFKTTVSQKVARSLTFASEVMRLSLRVRTGGIMGGQPSVPDVQGVWKVRDPVSILEKQRFTWQRVCRA